MRRPRESSGLRLGEVPVDMNLWARALKESVKKEVAIEVRSLVIMTINEVFRTATDALINGEAGQTQTKMLALPATTSRASSARHGGYSRGGYICAICKQPGHNARRCPQNPAFKGDPYDSAGRCQKCHRTKEKGHTRKCPYASKRHREAVRCYWCEKTFTNRISRGVHAWHAHRKKTQDIAKEAARLGDYNWINDRALRNSRGVTRQERQANQVRPVVVEPTQGRAFNSSLGTLKEIIRGGKWQRFLKPFEGKCTCCHEPYAQEPTVIPPGMSRKEPQPRRIKQLAFDFDTKGPEYLLKNYQVTCRGCGQANAQVPGTGRLTFPGKHAAYRWYATAFGRKCTECGKVPADKRTFLIRGPEETPLGRLKGFCLMLANEGTAAAKAKYPAICRGCWSSSVRDETGKIPKGVRVNVA